MMTHEAATAFFATQTADCRNTITRTVRAFQRQVKAGVVLPSGLVQEIARAVTVNLVSTSVLCDESCEFTEYLIDIMQQPLAD